MARSEVVGLRVSHASKNDECALRKNKEAILAYTETIEKIQLSQEFLGVQQIEV